LNRDVIAQILLHKQNHLPGEHATRNDKDHRPEDAQEDVLRRTNVRNAVSRRPLRKIGQDVAEAWHVTTAGV